MNIEKIWTFIQTNWTASIEILILTVVFYYGYLYLRGTRGARILMGLAIIFLTLTLVSQMLNLVVISWLVRSFSVFLAVALVVIFQPELRRALTQLGSHPFFSTGFQKRETIEELIDTVFELSSKGYGALIAVEREISLITLSETGVEVDCDYSKEIVLTIFFPKTVLHDGGMILRNDRIVAAACIFPLTQREDLDRHMGLRHRAGIGLTEESDAVAIIVSEETGQVSICHNGIIDRNLNVDKFRRRLHQLLLLEKYEKTDSEQLEGEADVPRPRDRVLVPHPRERDE